MFKSKYGLIGVILVLIFTALAYFWVKSSVSSKINSSAKNELQKMDYSLRHLEKSNEAMTITMASKGAMKVSALVKQYFSLQNKLTSIMQKQLKDLASEGEVPLYVAVLGNQMGVKQNMMINWMAINGTDVTSKVKDQWITTSLLNSLKNTKKANLQITKIKSKAKDTSKTTKDKKNKKEIVRSNKSNSKIKIPLFVGEKPGKYLVKPEIYKQILMDGVEVPMGLKLIKTFKKVKGDIYSPVFEGILVMGFKNKDLNRDANIMLKHGRDKELIAVVSQLNNVKKLIFKEITHFSQTNNKHFVIAGMTPHIMAITNNKGIVISRDKDDTKLSGYNYLKNNSGKLLFIKKAISSKTAVFDILTFEAINRFRPKSKPSNLFQAAAIPIFGENNKVVGCFFAAWPFDVQLAQFKNISTNEVAFFYGNSIFYPSFKGTSELKDIESVFHGRFGNVTTSPYTHSGKVAKIKGESFNIGGSKYLGAFYKYPMQTIGGEKYGYIILVSMDKLSKPFSGVIPLILIFGVFVILLMVVLENLVFFSFYSAIDKIDEGIQEVAAGDMDFVFGRVSKETEGLSNSLNEMLNIIFGRETDENEDGEAPAKEGIHLLSMGPVPEMPLLGDDKKVAHLNGLSDAEFEAQLYKDFVAAWKELGEEDPAPSNDLFRQRMKLYERMVLRQIECGRVLFEMTVTDDGIVVVPLPVS